MATNLHSRVAKLEAARSSSAAADIAETINAGRDALKAGQRLPRPEPVTVEMLTSRNALVRALAEARCRAWPDLAPEGRPHVAAR